MTPKNDTLIIDMTTAPKGDLIALSTILLNLNTSMACYGFRVTIKKSKSSTSPSAAKPVKS
jgi:hypothetical protein